MSLNSTPHGRGKRSADEGEVHRVPDDRREAARRPPLLRGSFGQEGGGSVKIELKIESKCWKLNHLKIKYCIFVNKIEIEIEKFREKLQRFSVFSRKSEKSEQISLKSAKIATKFENNYTLFSMSNVENAKKILRKFSEILVSI